MFFKIIISIFYIFLTLNFISSHLVGVRKRDGGLDGNSLPISDNNKNSTGTENKIPLHYRNCNRLNSICECPHDFEVTNMSKMEMCKPLCSPSCVHGICLSPNNCTCSEGYEKLLTKSNECTLASKEIKLLSTTAPVPNNESSSHVPVCNKNCLNGACNSSGQCECFREYEFKINSTSECQPVCSPSCTHGICLSPNNCTCSERYEKLSPDSNECTLASKEINLSSTQPPVLYNEGNSLGPVCNKNCTNGVCGTPGQCQCSPGYEFKINSTSDCQPICFPSCIHGICSSPGNCTCSEGYEKTSFNLYNCTLASIKIELSSTETPVHYFHQNSSFSVPNGLAVTAAVLSILVCLAVITKFVYSKRKLSNKYFGSARYSRTESDFGLLRTGYEDLEETYPLQTK